MIFNRQFRVRRQRQPCNQEQRRRIESPRIFAGTAARRFSYSFLSLLDKAKDEMGREQVGVVRNKQCDEAFSLEGFKEKETSEFRVIGQSLILGAQYSEARKTLTRAKEEFCNGFCLKCRCCLLETSRSLRGTLLIQSNLSPAMSGCLRMR
jgi:hypothetical protein